MKHEHDRAHFEAITFLLGVVLVAMMRFRPEGFLPSRQRAIEMHEAPPGQAEIALDAREPETILEAESEGAGPGGGM